METSATTLTPEHYSPRSVAEWGVSGLTGRQTDLKIELSPWTPYPVRVSLAPIHIWWNRVLKGNGGISVL